MPQSGDEIIKSINSASSPNMRIDPSKVVTSTMVSRRVRTFLQLMDTPVSYSGNDNKLMKVNDDGIDFIDGITVDDNDNMTIDNDLTVSGDFIFGDASTDELTVNGKLIVDNTDTEAVLVRKDGDTGDVFVVDTTNTRVGIGASPNLELDISSQATTSHGRMGVSNSDNTSFITFLSGHDTQEPKLFFDDSAMLEIGTASNQTGSSFTELFSFHSDGSFVVGDDSTPTGKFQIVADTGSSNIFRIQESSADGSSNLLTFDKGASASQGGRLFFGDGGASTVMSIDARSGNPSYINTGGSIGLGTTATSARVVIDQSDEAGAEPSLYLNQADVSEEMIQFESAIGTGNAIEAVGAKTLTTTHFIKVTLTGGLTRYIPVGTIA